MERQTASSKATEILAKQLFIQRAVGLEEADTIRDAAESSIRDASIFEDVFLGSDAYVTEDDGETKQ